MGLTLHASGCAKRVVNILKGVHLPLSYGSIQSSLDSVTTDALRWEQQEVQFHPFYINYDNLNVFQPVSDQTLGNSYKLTQQRYFEVEISTRQSLSHSEMLPLPFRISPQIPATATTRDLCYNFTL